MNNDNDNDHPPEQASLPQSAHLSINRCNLPPVILGSLTFQRHPMALELDGVSAPHGALYRHLDSLEDAAARAQRFMDYMTVHFRLEQPSDAGASAKTQRTKADYLRLIRGWLFDAEGREAAVIKGWAESRFGLRTRYHKGRLDGDETEALGRYQQTWAEGLLNTNALEAQLDLLYAFGQYEWRRQRPDLSHLSLFRGLKRLSDFDILEQSGPKEAVVLLNNVNSFSASAERAAEFGDCVIRVITPVEKVFYHSGLLPGRLQGEQEHLVIGGAYHVHLVM